MEEFNGREHTRWLDVNPSENPLCDFMSCLYSFCAPQAHCQCHPTSKSFYYYGLNHVGSLVDLRVYDSLSLPFTAQLMGSIPRAR